MIHRRLLLAGAAGLLAGAAQAAAATPIEVFKSPYCGCCGGWVAHLQASGFRVTVHDIEDVSPHRRRLGVPDRYASCHTGSVRGYAVEGHVPASDIRRLLQEKPVAAGLALPGMPLGSPGMEAPGAPPQRFDVLLVSKDGTAKLFQRHG
jgi:hypothetical protein